MSQSIPLSICIPTYNRARYLENCLQSLVDAAAQTTVPFEICVSDNGSTDHTPDIIAAFKDKLPLVAHRNPTNLGIPRNFLTVVGLAQGEFAWLVGDDDLVLPDAISRLCAIIERENVDHIFANSAHLNITHLDGFDHPFRCADLPSTMTPFSSYTTEGVHPYLDLVDPKVSFDFMGGMFLSVFRRSLWDANTHHLDQDAITSPDTFSHFDNTFPHIRIFANAFSGSKSWFAPDPFLVCITGVREWAPMYPLIHSIRLPEALEIFREQGLSPWRYHKARNFAVNNLIPELVRMRLTGKISGYHYIKPWQVLLRNALYPSVYLSPFYFIARRLRKHL